MSAPASRTRRWLLVSFAIASLGSPAIAYTHLPYDIGTPDVQELWVDPVNGDDGRSGATRPEALRTLIEAWSRIPRDQNLATGYHVKLVAGTYREADTPAYWEARWGTFAAPVILEAVDGPLTAHLPYLNAYDCRYLYLIGIDVSWPGGDVLHCEACDHLLLRRVRVRGDDPATYNVQEAIKVNQSTHVYIEEADVSGAWDNAIDFVGVQYGHVLASVIHDSGDWGMYAKGGSAHMRIEGNEFHDSGTGGFTSGQGTGLEFMTDPYLHYEAYDVKVVNNVFHDIDGAAVGAFGGYNVLVAYNTAYRVGARSHLLDVVFGERSCDGNVARCQAHLDRGGWGTAQIGAVEPIPDRHVYVHQNVIYNPAPFQSQWQHLNVFGPRSPSPGSNIPDPALADDDLRIRGNVIWNGPPAHPLGIEDPQSGCQPSNPTCNAAQLVTENHINTLEPELVDPSNGNFRPVAGGNLFSTTTYAIPDFPGGDWPEPPSPPPAYQGDLTNDVPVDRDGAPRSSTSPPGAYGGGTGGAATSLVLGAGPAASAPPVMAIHRIDGTPVASALAYGAGGYGVNVDAAELDSDPFGEVLAGPGPGSVYGPQVRAFSDVLTVPIQKVNFYAYGTLRFGVTARGASIDADAFDEILAAPGPGDVFGPHVRAWNYDGATVAAMSRVSFFAYGTLKFGANAASGDVDADGFEEILTGPGPGAVFSAQLRGFQYDGASVAAMPGINAVLLGGSTHGLYPAGGNADADPFDEIAAGSGPDPTSSSSVELLGFDGGPLTSLVRTAAYPASAGGVIPSMGDVDADGMGEVVTSARAPLVSPQVLAFDWDGGPWTALSQPRFDAFASYGATDGGVLAASY